MGRTDIIQNAYNSQMSYDLTNLTTRICLIFSKQFFTKALELGELYGWQPRRTQPPVNMNCCGTDAEWHGLYLTNDGQKVVASDAKWLAVTLKKALIDISETNPVIDWNPKLWVNDDLPEWLSPQEKGIMEDELQDGLLDILTVHPLDYFAGDEKQYLIKFIRFCSLGSFAIS
jgi:hypothetical protein